jgi:signal transduction histidine kinase
MKHLQRTFGHLKWKLTLSFLVVAIVSICLNELSSASYSMVISLSPRNQGHELVDTLDRISTQAAFYMKPPIDSKGLQAWLVQTATNDSSLSLAVSVRPNNAFQFLGVVNQEGKIIAEYGKRMPGSAMLLSSALPPAANVVLARILQGRRVHDDSDHPDQNIAIEADQTIFVAVPIPKSQMGEPREEGPQDAPQGALVLQAKLITIFDQLTTLPSQLSEMLPPLLPFLPTPFVLFIPLFLFANSFTRRLNRLTRAAEAWSIGDFSVVVQDGKHDEVGQLIQHLNAMTGRLQTLIVSQQQLATAEERNRLARELHDTIKQQIFALAFQIDIVKKLHGSHSDKLAFHVQEAQKILQEMQKEMANLILTMRPGAIGNKALSYAIEEHVYRWGQQHGVFVKFFPDVKEQARRLYIPTLVKESFFRVAQGALSNIARHSSASYVEVTLSVDYAQIVLKITDNGQGFDYNEKEECGTGIASMRERMKSIDGTLQIKSSVMQGTEVLAFYQSKKVEADITRTSTRSLVL